MFGRTAYNANDWYHTILWMEEALDRFKFNKDQSTTISKATILDYLAFAAYKVCGESFWRISHPFILIKLHSGFTDIKAKKKHSELI
jgi:hypothetical protein